MGRINFLAFYSRMARPSKRQRAGTSIQRRIERAQLEQQEREEDERQQEQVREQRQQEARQFRLDQQRERREQQRQAQENAERQASIIWARKLGLYGFMLDPSSEETKKDLKRVLAVMQTKFTSVLNKLKLLNSLADYQAVDQSQDLTENEEGERRHRAMKTMQLDYASRRFEIHIMTFEYQVCQCCSRGSITSSGLYFTADQTMQDPARCRKNLFSTHSPNSNGREDETLYYLSVNNVGEISRNDTGLAAENLHLMEPVCKICVKSLSQKKIPKFSPSSGFSHGVPRPECLQNLEWAEEALIALCQPVMAGKTLKFGMTSVTGHVVYVDRTNEITEVAQQLPRLQSEILVVELQRQCGNPHDTSNVRFKSFRCRRWKVQAALV